MRSDHRGSGVGRLEGEQLRLRELMAGCGRPHLEGRGLTVEVHQLLVDGHRDGKDFNRWWRAVCGRRVCREPGCRHLHWLGVDRALGSTAGQSFVIDEQLLANRDHPEVELQPAAVESDMCEAATRAGAG